VHDLDAEAVLEGIKQVDALEDKFVHPRMQEEFVKVVEILLQDEFQDYLEPGKGRGKVRKALEEWSERVDKRGRHAE
jgi:hypothetical protein